MTLEQWHVLALAVTAVLAGFNFGILMLLWARHERKRDQVENLHFRVSILEDRIGTLDEVDDRMATLASLVSALNERSKVMSMQLQSIEEYLRGAR